MERDSSEIDAVQLRELEAANPTEAMIRIERLIETHSVQELARTMQALYKEVSLELGIDWHFTALQWKIGNGSAGEFHSVCPAARFKVWSLLFTGKGEGDSEKRYTTCLPFQFRPEWIERRTEAAHL